MRIPSLIFVLYFLFAAGLPALAANSSADAPHVQVALNALGRSGVPAYALYAPGRNSPQLLPEVLTAGIVTNALVKLPKAAVSPTLNRHEFLKRGLVPVRTE